MATKPISVSPIASMLSFRHENSKMTLFASPLFSFIRAPSGMEDLLEGLAREVLRRQPENIHLFAAHYCEFLMHIRKEGMTALNMKQDLSRTKYAIVDSYPFCVQEPDVELPIRHLIQKKKFVPVDLQAYEKTDLQTQENLGQTEKTEKKIKPQEHNFEKGNGDTTAEDVVLQEQMTKKEDVEKVVEEPGKRKTLRSIGTQFTLIVEDYTDKNNKEVNERKEYNVKEYTKTEKVEKQLSTDTMESSTDNTTTQSSETFSESITDEKYIETSPASSQETMTDTFSQTTEDESEVLSGKTLNKQSIVDSDPNVINGVDTNRNELSLVEENEEKLKKDKMEEIVYARPIPGDKSQKPSIEESSDKLIPEETAKEQFSQASVGDEKISENTVAKAISEETAENLIPAEVVQSPMPEERIEKPMTEIITKESNSEARYPMPEEILQEPLPETAPEEPMNGINAEELILEPNIENIASSLEDSKQETIQDKSSNSTESNTIVELTKNTSQELVESTKDDKQSETILQPDADELDEIEELKKLISEGNVEELSKAATKLQSNFRGFKVRKEVEIATTSTKAQEDEEQVPEDSSVNDDVKLAELKDLVTNKTEEELEIEELQKLIEEGNPEELQTAATKLQANFRGFKARKEMTSSLQDKTQLAEDEDKENSELEKTGEQLEIEELQKLIEEGNPEELKTAATKLQANFRGFKARKEMTSPQNTSQVLEDEIKDSSELERTEEQLEIEELQKLIEEGNPEELQIAATKLQANFRGFKARKEINPPTSKRVEENSVVTKAEEQVEIEENSVVTEAEEQKELEENSGVTEAEEQKELEENSGVTEAEEQVELEENSGTSKTEGQIEPEENSEQTKTQKQVELEEGSVVKETEEQVKLEETSEVSVAKTDEQLEIEELQKLIEEGNPEELQTAATKLQANFRGFKARREMNPLPSNSSISNKSTEESSEVTKTEEKQEQAESSEETKTEEKQEQAESSEETKTEEKQELAESSEVTKTEEQLELEELQKLIEEGNPEELQTAATKLQANFRGFKARKEMTSSPKNTSQVEEDKIEDSPKEEKTDEQLEIEELQKLIEEGNPEELQTAATKLQANFRGFKARKEMTSSPQNTSQVEEDKIEDSPKEDKIEDSPKEEKTDEQLEIEELQKLIEEGNPEELQIAATKLQANFRGFKARKEMISSPQNTIQAAEDEIKENTESEKTEEQLEIEELQKLIAEGDTEELSKAATKLQSNFRGFKTRKEMQPSSPKAEKPNGELHTDELQKPIAEEDTKSATSEIDLTNQEVNKLKNEFKQVKEQKQDIIILQFAEELSDIEQTTINLPESTIKPEVDLLPEDIDNPYQTDKQQDIIFAANGRESVELLHMAEELVDNVIEEAVRASSAMSLKNGTVPLEEEEEDIENQSDTPISDIIEIVVEVMDNLMETIATEFDQKADKIPQTAEADPVVQTVQDLLDRVVEMDTSRNVYPENGESIEVSFADSAQSLQQFSPEETSRNPDNMDDNAEVDKELESIILGSDDNDPSIAGLEELVAAPPNSPALLMPLEELESETLVSPDSLDPVTASRIDGIFSPDSLAEPIPLDPLLFTPDSISDPTETQ